METREGWLDGRAVQLRKVGIGVAIEANEVRAETGNNFKAGIVIMAASAYWADTGERIFADKAAVEAWPMEDFGDIIALVTEATELNKAKDRSTGPKTTNGSGEHVGPSP